MDRGKHYTSEKTRTNKKNWHSKRNRISKSEYCWTVLTK